MNSIPKASTSSAAPAKAAVYCPCGGLMFRIQHKSATPLLKCVRCRSSKTISYRAPQASSIKSEPCDSASSIEIEKVCLVPHCLHNSSQLAEISRQILESDGLPCPEHKLLNCTCLRPYAFIPFPSSPDLRRLWLNLVRKNELFQLDSEKHAICSDHFVDTSAYSELPFPVLNMGLNRHMFSYLLNLNLEPELARLYWKVAEWYVGSGAQSSVQDTASVSTTFTCSKIVNHPEPKKQCCVAYGCKHGSVFLKEWIDEHIHNGKCSNGSISLIDTSKCCCPKPFELFRFPSNNPSLQRVWCKLVRRDERFCPDDERHAICSIHFLKQTISEKTPFPMLNLGFSKRGLKSILSQTYSSKEIDKFMTHLDRYFGCTINPSIPIEYKEQQLDTTTSIDDAGKNPYLITDQVYNDRSSTVLVNDDWISLAGTSSATVSLQRKIPASKSAENRCLPTIGISVVQKSIKTTTTLPKIDSDTDHDDFSEECDEKSGNKPKLRISYGGLAQPAPQSMLRPAPKPTVATVNCSQTKQCAENRLYCDALVSEIQDLGRQINTLQQQRQTLLNTRTLRNGSALQCAKCDEFRASNKRMLAECETLRKFFREDKNAEKETTTAEPRRKSKRKSLLY